MAQIRIVWDEAAIRLDTQQQGSAVDRAMSRLADDAMAVMKRLAPVYSGPPRIGPVGRHTRQTARRSGTLRSSIRKFRQPDGSYLVGPTDQVAPGVFLGPMIERGTRPHEIVSHGPWPLYSTATRKVYGRPLYEPYLDAAGRERARLAAWRVHHPGTRPRPFIEPAARSLNGRTLRIS